MKSFPALLLSLLAPLALAGGSNYGTPAGTPARFAGQVSEWPVPTPAFARDPAVAPDGSIFVAVMQNNKVAHFDPTTQTFKEWDLPPGHHPHGVLVDRKGMVWTTGNGNGTIGRLDPATGEMQEYRTPSASGEIVEYPSSGGPYGIALDKVGQVWFCRMGDDKLGILDPATGAMSELALPEGSRPRRMATAPDGSLWVTLYGSGKLAQIDPVGRQVMREIPLPAGPKGGPYAVTVDGAGTVWANEIATDTVVRLDPRAGDLRVIQLPSKGVGIRKMIVDARGQLWYMGSHNGRLGVVR